MASLGRIATSAVDLDTELHELSARKSKARTTEPGEHEHCSVLRSKAVTVMRVVKVGRDGRRKFEKFSREVEEDEDGDVIDIAPK